MFATFGIIQTLGKVGYVGNVGNVGKVINDSIVWKEGKVCNVSIVCCILQHRFGGRLQTWGIMGKGFLFRNLVKCDIHHNFAGQMWYIVSGYETNG